MSKLKQKHIKKLNEHLTLIKIILTIVLIWADITNFNLIALYMEEISYFYHPH